MQDKNTKRVFFSFHVPEDITSRLIDDLSGTALNMYPPENLHITIKFIGDATPDTILQLNEIASRVAGEIPSISFTPKTLSVVDSRLRLTVQKTPVLAELERRISRELSRFPSIKVDPRPYTPHITLARPLAGFDISSVVLDVSSYTFSRNSFGLWQSEQGEQKMGRYTLLNSFELTGSQELPAREKISRIALPSRPQPDTLVSIFILKTFGREVFPGIESAGVEVRPQVEGGDDDYEKQGILLLDLGGGRFDHHNKNPKTTTTRLITEFLGIAEDPALAKLLEYTQRDDFFGRGTVSADAIDRALGLSGLIAALNRQNPKDPNRVADIVLPLIQAHYEEERRRTGELPQEFESKKAAGDVAEFDVKQRGKKLKVVMVRSDNPSLAGFLRSQVGGRYDVVLQRADSGHTNILTRPTKHVDLRELAAAIRMLEAEKHSLELENVSFADLSRPGRFAPVKEWYYDRATNSIQNGGLNPQDVLPTSISWEEFQSLLKSGLSGEIFKQPVA